MAAAPHRRREAEGEEEALFGHSLTLPVYYVQSPSAASHAASSDGGNPREQSSLLSPFPRAAADVDRASCREAASRLALSRYSSSRGSNISVQLHETKIAYELGGGGGGRRQRPGVAGGGEDTEVAAAAGKMEDSGVWKYLALDPSASRCCISAQVAWRLAVSAAAALLVFFLATSPPAPRFSVKISGVERFVVGEGVDEKGVNTKVLSCNCSVDVSVENPSKVFPLHVRPSTLHVAFHRLLVATSHPQGAGAYVVGSGGATTVRLFVGTAHRPMYAAGSSMQELLESGRGLPLTIRLRSASGFRVVGRLVRKKYRHRADCLLVLDGTYDERRLSQGYNSSCSVATVRA